MQRDYVIKSFRPPVSLQIDYKGELNDQQFSAVTAPKGPSLVIAGAGAGKTRTLIYRVAFLLEQGIPAERILLLTFTNKAAKEMMRRVANLLGSDVTSIWGGTFHSIAVRILKRHAEKIGFRSDFTIMDREDAKDLLSTCITEAEIDVKETRFPKPTVLADIFSLAVNKQVEIKELLESDFDHFANLTRQIEDLQKRYVARKQAVGMMDFDDLLVFWLKLLQEHKDIRERYQRRFQFVLVDEYQDTNKLQSDIIDLLAERSQNVMVVGDDSQSIYSWRGANFQNILAFPERYPEAKVYKIETNYRSTPEILNFANAAIAPNINQYHKELTPVRPSGVVPSIVACETANEQSTFVAQRALELRDEGIELDDMAILYRSHFHAMELQMELTRRNIPFAITSGIRFFEQAHIKDVAAYLKFVTNLRDELSFKRLVKMLPGIGAKGADKLWELFRKGIEAPNPSTKKATTKGESQPIATALAGCSAKVPKKANAAWAQFAATLSQLEVEPVRDCPSAMIELIIDAGYDDYLKTEFTNYRSRLEDVEQLAQYARQFKNTEEFLAQLALETNLDAEPNQPASSDDERIRLSTVHQAKGLEFRVVFVIMLCEGMFPNARSMRDEDAEEEERRLFYVAVTRAKDELYLCFPHLRFTHGAGGDLMQRPSRFLSELPEAVYDDLNLRRQSHW